MQIGLTLGCMILGAIFYKEGGLLGGYAVGNILGLIYTVVVFIPNLAVSVRRLHDTGRSGVNMFWVFLPLIGAIILLVYMLTGSNVGDNAYGPQPEK